MQLDLDPRNLGRGGGFVVAVLGVAALVGAGYMFANDWRAFYSVGTASFGVVLLLAALAAVRNAAPALEPAMSKAALHARIAEQALPFTVCTACHALEPGVAIGCARCGSVTGCVPVESDAERSLARSALG
ncbi:MAG: hypothetical protein U0168_27805 [Nannocystaceae bacterium]